MKEYFSHDYSSREDEKIKNLIFRQGWAGYGLYWGLIEMLYQNNGYLQINYERIAFDLRTENGLIDSLINEFDLFKIKGDKFYSESVLRRLKERDEKSDKARENILKRWNKDKYKDTDVIPPYNNSNTNKEKESKLNKRKEYILPNKADTDFIKQQKKKKKTNLPGEIPPYEEFEKYALEKEPNINIQVLKGKYESWVENGWKTGYDKPIKNWKSTILNTLPYLQKNGNQQNNASDEFRQDFIKRASKNSY